MGLDRKSNPGLKGIILRAQLLLVIALLFSGTACNFMEKPKRPINWQGHRGARGIYPENTWPAFQNALEQHMQTLEMDVVLTADSQVVVSHEPFLSHEICLDSTGYPIRAEDEADYNIFHMSYADLQNFDCGSKPHPRFPDQKKQRVCKPLLKDIIERSESFPGQDEVFYNIEVKSKPEWDGLYYHSVDSYTAEVVNVISRSGIFSRTILQSFDKRCLAYAHIAYPELQLALLVESNADFQNEMEQLGFHPDIYSPGYTLVNAELVVYCRENNIQLIPWTVNTVEDAKQLINAGVNGIITDYPAISKRVN